MNTLERLAGQGNNRDDGIKMYDDKQTYMNNDHNTHCYQLRNELAFKLGRKHSAANV